MWMSNFSRILSIYSSTINFNFHSNFNFVCEGCQRCSRKNYVHIILHEIFTSNKIRDTCKLQVFALKCLFSIFNTMPAPEKCALASLFTEKIRVLCNSSWIWYACCLHSFEKINHKISYIRKRCRRTKTFVFLFKFTIRDGR